jgi:hypothetical protein
MDLPLSENDIIVSDILFDASLIFRPKGVRSKKPVACSTVNPD